MVAQTVVDSFESNTDFQQLSYDDKVFIGSVTFYLKSVTGGNDLHNNWIPIDNPCLACENAYAIDANLAVITFLFYSLQCFQNTLPVIIGACVLLRGAALLASMEEITDMYNSCLKVNGCLPN